MIIQNAGATTPSEKFSATLDRRPRDAGLVVLGGVAPDDLCDCFTARGNATVLQRVGDARHMDEQAALGEKCASDDSNGNQPEGQKEQALLDDEGHQTNHAEQRKHGHARCHDVGSQAVPRRERYCE
jgi:hypothetical protein